MKSMTAFLIALIVLFLRATGADDDRRRRRPVVIMVNGYDASVSDMYLAMGLQAVARGYHVVLVDGPGQGALLQAVIVVAAGD